MSNLTSPRSSVIIRDDFLGSAQLSYVLESVKSMKGTFSREGYENRAYLRDKMDPRFCGTKYIKDRRNILFSIWESPFWPTMLPDMIDVEDSIYQHAFYTRGYGDQVLLSVYGDGDYYGRHIDTDMGCCVTAVLMLCFNHRFSGGSLIVNEQEVPFKNNRLIVFPSCFPHEVTKIENDSDEYTDQRFTLQYFVSAVSLKKPLIDESSRI